MFHASKLSSGGTMKMFPVVANLPAYVVEGRPQEMVDKRNISGDTESTDQLIKQFETSGCTWGDFFNELIILDDKLQ